MTEENENNVSFYEKARNKPNVISEVVKEIVDTFKPDDDFIVSLIKRLAMEMENNSFMVQIVNICNDFRNSNFGLSLTKEQVDQVRKKFGI